jgi:hypothetical protein
MTRPVSKTAVAKATAEVRKTAADLAWIARHPEADRPILLRFYATEMLAQAVGAAELANRMANEIEEAS